MKIVYWILGIVVVAGVGYVGYQYGNGNIKLGLPKSNVVVPVNTDTTGMQDVLKNATYPTPLTWPTNTVTNTIGSSIIDKFANTVTGGATNTVTWKTYTNADLKFSIQYPSDYTVTDKLPKLGATPVESGPSQTLTFSKMSDSLQPRFSLWVNPAGFGPIFSDIFYRFTVNKTGTTIAERTVQEADANNTNGVQELYGHNWSENGEVASGSNGYTVVFQYKEGGADYEPTFTKILKSLKNL